MPPMSWPEVYTMYCNAIIAVGLPAVVVKGVQGVLGADPWLSLYRAAREVRHVREAGEDSQGFATHGGEGECRCGVQGPLEGCLRHAQGGYAILADERCVLRAWLHAAQSMPAHPH